jgi:hypothetical protein
LREICDALAIRSIAGGASVTYLVGMPETEYALRSPARTAGPLGRPTVALLVLLALVGLPAAAEPPAPAPQWVTGMWTELVGTWVADNSAYRDERDTMDAYGIEWRWGIGRKSLVGRLYGIKDGKEAGTFWEFREFWHPGERRLIAAQFGSDGSYGAGPHEREPDGYTRMLQTFFDPEAGNTFEVGHRARLEGDVHTTTSFNVDEAGTWTKRRAYVWKRQPPGP